MTSGGAEGTSGSAGISGFASRPWLVVVAVGFGVTLVNATSVIMEWQRAGHAFTAWHPFVWEFSSYAAMLALAPFFWVSLSRLPPRRDNLPVFGALHAALTLPYSLLHQTGFVALRKLAYAIAGDTYDFTHGQPLTTFFYEWRKDLIGYLIILAIYWYFFSRESDGPRVQPSGDRRIEIRDGATAVFLDPAEILRVEAAGNYVEFHTATGSHLVRGTLATWEAKLAPLGFVRAHRSRIVNRARIRAIKPTPAGDLVLTLDDGSDLVASRRFRAGLEAGRAGANPAPSA